jgi:oligopeptide transport system ATP-binding protein
VSTQDEPLLRVVDLTVDYAVRAVAGAPRSTLRAVDQVSFDIAAGDVLALVGESGCGKSTTGLATLRLVSPSGGQVWFRGQELLGLRSAALRELRRDLQIVFQHPGASLNPRMRVGELLNEPLAIHRALPRPKRRERIMEVLDLVGLSAWTADRYPHEFSGGQQQRIAIARAVMLSPAFVVLDEAVASLDVSIRAQILNLLADLRSRLGLTYLLISHDLSIVRHVADRIAVMYLGRIVETGARDELFARPLHPYTRALLSAVPIPDPQVERHRRRIVLSGDVPSPLDPPSGCRFRTRCPWAQPLCAEIEPKLEQASAEHSLACHFWREIEGGTP